MAAPPLCLENQISIYLKITGACAGVNPAL